MVDFSLWPPHWAAQQAIALVGQDSLSPPTLLHFYVATPLPRPPTYPAASSPSHRTNDSLLLSRAIYGER
jgi:hypothetical protein